MALTFSKNGPQLVENWLQKGFLEAFLNSFIIIQITQKNCPTISLQIRGNGYVTSGSEHVSSKV